MTIARPGHCSSAVRMTSGSVESICSGAREVSAMRFTVSRMSVLLVVALDERDAEVEDVRAALDLVLGDLHEARRSRGRAGAPSRGASPGC